MGTFARLNVDAIGDRRSLRWKLPWLLATTSALTVLAFGVFAYLSARAVAADAASTRLRSALSQVRTVAELGVTNQLAALRELERNEVIIHALRTTGPVSDSAVRLLRALKGVSDSTVLVELVDHAGVVRHAIPSLVTGGEQRRRPAVAYAAMGPLEQTDGAVKFAATVGVSSAANDLVGWIRVVRQHRNAVNRSMAARLIEGVVLLSGNADGRLLNPDEVIPYPVSTGGDARRYVRNGERWLSVSTLIPNTPWIYVLELPEHVSLAPANALILPLVIIGFLVAVAGALFGQRLSRRITGPLAALTGAAEALARGERSAAMVATHRDDEIGRLSRAFSAMTTSVLNARATLEAEVEARTGELTTTAARLRTINEELRESEKLAFIGRMSGSVGHELRNPLGVMSNVVFLIDQLPEASGELRNYVNQLREQIRLSDRIISDLLDRAKSGQPIRSVVHLDRLLDDIVLRAELPDSVRVERSFLKPVPPLILDHHHLAQILWNLVRNAVQAMDQKGGVLTFAVDYTDGTLRIEVHDSGDGVSEADAERIFEPMFTTKSDGIGLGLSISRAFARANGGDLTLRMGVRGACFVLEMQAEIAAYAAESPETRGTGPHPAHAVPALGLPRPATFSSRTPA